MGEKEKGTRISASPFPFPSTQHTLSFAFSLRVLVMVLARKRFKRLLASCAAFIGFSLVVVFCFSFTMSRHRIPFDKESFVAIEDNMTVEQISGLLGAEPECVLDGPHGERTATWTSGHTSIVVVFNEIGEVAEKKLTLQPTMLNQLLEYLIRRSDASTQLKPWSFRNSKGIHRLFSELHASGLGHDRSSADSYAHGKNTLSYLEDSKSRFWGRSPPLLPQDTSFSR